MATQSNYELTVYGNNILLLIRFVKYILKLPTT
jgi:hypothetical protein